MINRVRLLVEGLSAFRAVDKLVQGGVEVLSAQKTQKNGVFIDVKSKDRKKAFAILCASCYNVKKVSFRGFTRIVHRYRSRVGVLLGAILFCVAVPFVQTRVLRIFVSGSGACYEAEVRQILANGGVREYAGFPQETSSLIAQILALPRVSYCSFLREGGVLTVEVQVSDDGEFLSASPLVSPVNGELLELTVVRGRACASVGDGVLSGDILVDCMREDGSNVLVIASAKIAFSEYATFSAESEEGALAQARLIYAQAEELAVSQESAGWLISGIVRTALNLV